MTRSEAIENILEHANGAEFDQLAPVSPLGRLSAAAEEVDGRLLSTLNSPSVGDWAGRDPGDSLAEPVAVLEQLRDGALALGAASIGALDHVLADDGLKVG